MATSKFKRFGIPTALVVGGVTAGSLFAPLGLASAQDDDTGTDTDLTEGSDSSAETDGSGFGHKRLHRAIKTHRGLHALRTEAVTEALGLTAEEVRDGLADGNTVAELAEQQGVSREELIASLVDSITAAIEQAVEDGKVDADKAAEKLADVETMVEEFIDKDPSEIHRHGRGNGGGHGFGPLAGASEEVQELLGLSAEEIRAGLADGQSLADLAEQQAVSIEDLTDLLVANATERIDQAVEDGKVDTERAEEAKANLEEMIQNGLNAEFDGRGGFGRRGHHRHFGGSDGGDPDGADVAPESSVEESSA